MMYTFFSPVLNSKVENVPLLYELMNSKCVIAVQLIRLFLLFFFVIL